MTEDEAKIRWCPMARIRDDEENGLSVNRHSEHGIPISCMCMASECMMWVWNTVDVLATTPEDAEIVREHLKGGHCGLVK